ncbi:hypothetical protein F2Q70_00013068 [Brassica cretica]|uniref:Uncharacterized protein n=1 Tax=Brassica cretica TaxID=69181 RepID=A0A8S9M3J5_BRACR|nr:hypothetical protein F2Q70_00013068 [Brassica cretica]
MAWNVDPPVWVAEIMALPSSPMRMKLGTRGVPRDREQPSRLFCVKVTKRYSFLPLLFQLVHLPSSATPDLS